MGQAAEVPVYKLFGQKHRSWVPVGSWTVSTHPKRMAEAVERYAEMGYYGYWLSPEREMLQAAVDESQKPMSGSVRIKLYKGTASVVGRRSDNSLYDPELATFEADEVYAQADATGFIRLNALRLRVRNLLAKKRG